jgi:uncharacterized membrane protein
MPGARHPRVDALRGLALVSMTAYHFAFDLNHFGYIRQNFYDDPLWTLQRTAIVSLFLFTAGLGQVLAVQAGRAGGALGGAGAGRGLRGAGVAGLVVDVSAQLDQLRCAARHGGDAAAGACRFARARPARRLALAAGPGADCRRAAAGPVAAAQAPPALAAALDGRWLNGLGVVTHKPVTEDYVPLLPWLGVMLLGVGAARALPQAWLGGPVGPVGRGLARLGRHSLAYYMLHQPVLIGALMGWGALRGF